MTLSYPFTCKCINCDSDSTVAVESLNITASLKDPLLLGGCLKAVTASKPPPPHENGWHGVQVTNKSCIICKGTKCYCVCWLTGYSQQHMLQWTYKTLCSSCTNSPRPSEILKQKWRMSNAAASVCSRCMVHCISRITALLDKDTWRGWNSDPHCLHSSEAKTNHSHLNYYVNMPNFSHIMDQSTSFTFLYNRHVKLADSRPYMACSEVFW